MAEVRLGGWEYSSRDWANCEPVAGMNRAMPSMSRTGAKRLSTPPSNRHYGAQAGVVER